MSFESCFGGFEGSKSAPAAMGGKVAFGDCALNDKVAPQADLSERAAALTAWTAWSVASRRISSPSGNVTGADQSAEKHLSAAVERDLGDQQRRFGSRLNERPGCSDPRSPQLLI